MHINNFNSNKIKNLNINIEIKIDCGLLADSDGINQLKDTLNNLFLSLNSGKYLNEKKYIGIPLIKIKVEIPTLVKLPKDWLRNNQTKEFIESLSFISQICLTNLVKVNNGGNNQGIWMHENVAIKFSWLAPKIKNPISSASGIVIRRNVRGLKKEVKETNLTKIIYYYIEL